MKRRSVSHLSPSLFFEFIQLSLGTRHSLSCVPSVVEWNELYINAHRQAILGVCFRGVQKISQQCPAQAVHLPMELRMQWLALAAEIQKRNEHLDLRCAELQESLRNDGLQACVLKGQGVAGLYRPQDNPKDKSLERLRQPGDIDVWVNDIDIPGLTEYLRQYCTEYDATAAHVECEFFPGVSVEFHAKPGFLRNVVYDRRLQRWAKSFDWKECKDEKGFMAPSEGFNLVFLLVHFYHHFLYEGVGFRQLMDYYMLIYTIHDESRQSLYKEALSTLDSFGMQKFIRGVMYVMQEVFMMPCRMMLCEPDPKVGQPLLADMLESGNMGKYHSNKTADRSNPIIWHWTNFKRNLSFLSISPAEILSSPFWSLWHWGWRMRKL